MNWFFFNTSVFTTLNNINNENINHLWPLMKRTLRVNDDPSTPAVQTLSSVSKNVAAKVLRAVHGKEFLGSEDSPLCVPGEKSQRYLFSHVATDASLLLAGNTRRAVMAVEKVDRYLVSPQTRCPACWNSLPKEDAEKLERHNFYSQSEAFALLGFTGHHLYII